MANVLVTRITKAQNSLGRHEDITHIGNPAANWVWTRERVIASIDAKQNTFYLIDPRNGMRSYIGVYRTNDGRIPYLRAFADGKWNDSLLSLPETPAGGIVNSAVG